MERQLPKEKKNRKKLIGGIAAAAGLIAAIAVNEHRDSIHHFIDATIGTESSNSGHFRPRKIELPFIEDSYLEEILKSEVDPKEKYPETFLFLDTISLS